MSASCDLCKASSLEQVYAARNSGGKRTVWLCTYCGLLQSLPRSRKRVETPPASHRKRLRADTTLATLKPFLLKNKPLRVLDVGAGHGAFALELKGAHPKANIIGIEPDARAVGEWSIVQVSGQWRLRCDARAPGAAGSRLRILPTK